MVRRESESDYRIAQHELGQKALKKGSIKASPIGGSGEGSGTGGDSEGTHKITKSYVDRINEAAKDPDRLIPPSRRNK